MATAKANRKKKPLRVGNHVRFPYGAREAEAVVIEDRGNLGVGGRQIVRIRILGRGDPLGSDDPLTNIEEDSFEMPAEEVTPISWAR